MTALYSTEWGVLERTCMYYVTYERLTYSPQFCARRAINNNKDVPQARVLHRRIRKKSYLTSLSTHTALSKF